MINDLNIRILIGSHKTEDSQKFLRLVKQIIESNGFRQLFPEIQPEMSGGKPSQWNQRSIRLKRPKSLVDNTIDTTSQSSQVVGRHYDLAIFDDLVTGESVSTPDMIAKTREFHELSQSLLDPGAREICVGTRYAYDDEYGHIIKNLSDDYEITIQAAIDERTGLPIFPTRFHLGDEDIINDKEPMLSKYSLPKLRRVMGSYNFNAQYMLNPVNPEQQLFMVDKVKIVKELPSGPLTWFQVVDFSTTAVTKDSYTALVTGAVDHEANVYIVDIFWGNHDPHSTAMEIVKWQKGPSNRRPIKLGSERGPIDRTIRPFLEQMFKEHKVYVPIAYLPGVMSNRPKEERIRGLQPWVEEGRFHILESCRHKDVLIEEMSNFPRGGHLDILDACANIEQIMFPAGRPVSAVKNEFDGMEDIVGPHEEALLGRDRFIGEHPALARVRGGYGSGMVPILPLGSRACRSDIKGH